MVHTLSERIWEILACPDCGHSLQRSAGAEVVCAGCDTTYSFSDSGQLDLRLKAPKKYQLDYVVGDPLLSEPDLSFEPLSLNPAPELDADNIDVPPRLTRELISYFPRGSGAGSLMLDLGCGTTVHESLCEQAGFEYVGLDYDSAQAPILGDAHALPFRDNSFDFVLSMAVLHLIRYPLVMMEEVHRVMKPNGRFIGSVAFLEPYSGYCFYQHTHLGTLNSLQYGGFSVDRIAPSAEWSGLTALGQMALFPRMPRALAGLLVWPLETLHKLWWRLAAIVRRKPNETRRILNATGAFAFVATKPPGHRDSE